MKSRGTGLYSAAMKLVTSIALSSIGLYISFLWILRDMYNEPQLSFIAEASLKSIFFEIIIPILLLGLSYGVLRDSLLDFLDVLKERRNSKELVWSSKK